MKIEDKVACEGMRVSALRNTLWHVRREKQNAHRQQHQGLFTVHGHEDETNVETFGDI